MLARTHFYLFVGMPLGIALALISSHLGCQREPLEKKPIKAHATTENLQAAYGRSVKWEHMYTRFVEQAQKEHLSSVAYLYRAVARSEKIHASNHAELLRKIGVQPIFPIQDSVVVGLTLQTLKMALSSEKIETESMYPGLIRTAEQEGFAEASVQFQTTMQADARHFELFKEAYDRVGKTPKVQYLVCTKCGYLLTTDKTEECPLCHAKKDKFERV